MSDDHSAKNGKPYNPPSIKPRLGRPWFQIDVKEVEKLAAIGCTDEEIADWLGCKTDLLRRRKNADDYYVGLDPEDFSGVLKRARAKVKKSLRRYQLAAARKGNATMCIWLGKQLLGQRDRPFEHSTENEDDRRWVSSFHIDGKVMVVDQDGPDPVEAYHREYGDTEFSGEGSKEP